LAGDVGVCAVNATILKLAIFIGSTAVSTVENLALLVSDSAVGTVDNLALLVSGGKVSARHSIIGNAGTFICLGEPEDEESDTAS